MNRVLLVLVGCCVCLPVAFAQGLTKEVVHELKAATVYVEVACRNYFTDERTTASGSGFVVNEHGFVATNWHVVQPMVEFRSIPYAAKLEHILVYFHSGTPDEEVFDATVVAVDKRRDVAILATTAKGRTPVRFGDPGELFETSPVWAFGFPLGEAFAVLEKGPEVAVMRGTVSALRHNDRRELDAIQTDTPFNVGNSGGALINQAGEVVGMPSAIIGMTRINFAVPITAVRELMRTVPMAHAWTPQATVQFRVPAGKSRVYIDGNHVGDVGPQQSAVAVTAGWHQVAVQHPEHPLWLAERVLRDGNEIEVTFPSRSESTVLVRTPADSPTTTDDERAQSPVVPSPTDTLLKELFESRDVLQQMEQRTGNTDMRTWYVRDGKLHQHDDDGVLHAIFMGQDGWQDYAFGADVKIAEAEADSRAGLIFRETSRGFYLFRIHRQSDKAQLAYHSKAPFGWFILDERPLDADVNDQVNRLEIYAKDENILCTLNGKAVFHVRDDLAKHGRVGFYSVEGKAVFDNALVRRVRAVQRAASKTAAYREFWLTDSLDSGSNWWSFRYADGRQAPPWLFSDGGAVALDDSAALRLNMMGKFRFANFTANLIYTINQGEKGARFGFVFGQHLRDGIEHDYRVVLDREKKMCQLFVRAGDQENLLKETHCMDLFGSVGRLDLTVDEKQVSCAIFGRELLSHELDVALPNGRFGILSSGVRLFLHRLTVAAPARPVAEAM